MLPMVQPSSSGPVDTATLELLSKWKQEDATENPEEVRAGEREVSEFRKAMNEGRAEGNPFFIRELPFLLQRKL
jgi:hypothetical protein